MTEPPHNWRREIMGEFQPNIPLLKLAHEYHERCDSYDEMICGNTEGRPTNGWQHGEINRHAKRVLYQLQERQHREGILGDLLTEIRKMSR